MTSTAFFDRATSDLARHMAEARRYLADRAVADWQDLSVAQSLVASMETMRLVARLTQAMAWLQTQRAVQTGELTAAEAASPEHRLGGRVLCGVESVEEGLPAGLRDLLAASLALYSRIARLDDLAADTRGAAIRTA